MVKLSIIIPVYNTEKYLRRCIESILGQTFTDWEMILVDDGSTDSSAGICDEYAQNDPRISVVHKTNAGVSSARNKGLDRVTGEWVYFCDSDDRLAHKDSLSVMMDLSRGSELAVAGIRYVGEDGNLISYSSVKEDFKSELDTKSYLKIFYGRNPEAGYQGYLMTKLFSAAIIRDNALRFDEDIKYAEDALFVARYCCQKEVSKVNIDVSLKIYDYYMRSDSAMGVLSRKYNPAFFTDFLSFERMLHLVKNRFSDNDLTSLAIDRLAASARTNLNMLANANINDEEVVAYIDRALSEYPDVRKKLYASRALVAIRKEAMSLPVEKRPQLLKSFLHSEDCHWKYLTPKWKLLYILSAVAGTRGLMLIKNKLNFN